jgi:hypothetical protein
MSHDRHIEKLLGEVTGSMDELGIIEQEYKRSKQRVREQLGVTIHRLAELADSQAVRAQILRELYWKHRISAEIIGDAFGLEMRRIAGLAGAYTIKCPCANECGSIVEETFTSRAELERHESSRGRYICAACTKREKEESERQYSQLKRASAQRKAELRAMSWPEFTDTLEWVRLRNNYLESVGFRCEICGASGVGLYVCLHKETSEYPTPAERLMFFGAGGGTHSYVLCQACVKRCEDLLHPEWRERLGADAVARIERDPERD